MANNLFVGVDLGRSTRIAIVNYDGLIIKQDRVPTELKNGRAMVDSLIGLIKNITATAYEPVASVGIGLPGLINYRTQQVKILPHFPDVSTIDIRRELRQALGIPVILDNDANVAGYAEWQCGAAIDKHDCVYLTLGTGIGGAVIMDNRMLHGAQGFAGEIGHTKVGADELECSCGSMGCLETVASGPNIVRRIRERFFTHPDYNKSLLKEKTKGRLTCEDVVDAALKGDNLSRLVLAETARYLGIAIANVVNILNVEMVVLGGPVMAAGEFLLSTIRHEASSRCFAPMLNNCSIAASRLGSDTGIIGAAMMARDIVNQKNS